MTSVTQLCDFRTVSVYVPRLPQFPDPCVRDPPWPSSVTRACPVRGYVTRSCHLPGVVNASAHYVVMTSEERRHSDTFCRVVAPLDADGRAYDLGVLLYHQGGAASDGHARYGRPGVIYGVKDTDNFNFIVLTWASALSIKWTVLSAYTCVHYVVVNASYFSFSYNFLYYYCLAYSLSSLQLERQHYFLTCAKRWSIMRVIPLIDFWWCIRAICILRSLRNHVGHHCAHCFYTNARRLRETIVDYIR